MLILIGYLFTQGSRPFSSRRGYGSTSDVPTQMSAGGVGDRQAGDRSSYHRYSRRQPTTGTALDNSSSSETVDYKKVSTNFQMPVVIYSLCGMLHCRFS